ncbi:MAG: NADPH:quinone reductase [Thermoguttaceae bacterium]|nr:NADPH:quinone reductase [Thermoguttaceae bacterium]MDW8078604.1 NADPH:quinone reductase [Thermoguttaceae bacterium]
MKAAFIERTGPPEVIVYGELPKPVPRGSQVLVRVKAVSVNPVDTYVRAGMIPWDLPKPFIVGCDLAGVVEDVGPEVKRFRPGDRVWGSNQGLLGRQGTFAEYVAVDECWLYPTPANVSDRDAAALALVAITAHLGLFDKAKLQPGETVFVYGGAGGVGSCVVQMAKIAGARVITTARGEEKAKLCRELGADVVIDYTKEDIDQVLREVAPGGVNIWWETLREQNLERAVQFLAPFGRLILMAGRDSKPVFPVGPFYVRDCSAFGFAMFNASPEKQRACADDINRWAAEGKLRAVIGRVMPLSETVQAHRLQEENTIGKAGTLTGKIVLEP